MVGVVKTTTMLLTTVTALAATLALAGCSGSGGGSGTTTATATATTTTTATVPSTTGPSSTPSPSGTSTGGTGTGGGATDGPTSAAGGRCVVGQLKGGTAPGGGGAAGSVGIAITLTNTGTASCTLQGWPGVSFVGGGDGKQIGAAATLDRTSGHPTVTLAPGGSAQAAVKITEAGNYSSSDCSPQAADGFRVYPPGSTASLFIPATGYTACASTSIHLLTTGALTAGPTAS